MFYEPKIMSKVLNIFQKTIYIYIVFLILMSTFRLYFFNYYSPLDSLENYYYDILNAFILGFRIDLTVIGYIQALPTIALIFFYYAKSEKVLKYFLILLKLYLFYVFLSSQYYYEPILVSIHILKII